MPNTTINASPTKRFFVDMLTRDIELQDAVLDLLDNCIDGVLRSGFDPSAERPYEGFWAKLQFSGDRFVIEDNCGGISKKLAKESAFRMGRPKGANGATADLPTVGMYGIGMKRAIFKMGRQCQVISHTKAESWKVVIPETWFTREDQWKLSLSPVAKTSGEFGTRIEVSRLEKPIAAQFGSPTGFVKTFRSTVSQHYGLIIEKGFEVIVNGEPVKPLPIIFRSVELSGYKEGIAPFMFRGKVDGVKVDLSVGFYSPVRDDDDDEDEEGTVSSDEAGWTVICNDRIVLYRDKTRLTGWGEAGVPNFHNQFIGIAGVVHFRSNEPLKLPLTTTKRGIDAGSDTYLRVKDKMREGMKKFTSYTNRLKKDPRKRDEIFKQTASVELRSLKQTHSKLKWSKDRKLEGETFDPTLPSVGDADRKTIRFTRPIEEIRKVARHLLDDAEALPSEVGEACFDKTLAEVKRK